MLRAAKKLFSSKGINKSTIEQIAELADVATPTVYALFGSKAGIIREIGQTFVFGTRYKTLVEQSVSHKDPVESLKLAATITVTIFEMEMDQMGFLWSGPSIHPDLQELVSRLEEQRFERQKFIIERLEKQNLLPLGMSRSVAREILWALTGRELFRKLVKEKSWSHSNYEKWLEVTLTTQLLRNC